MSHPQFPECNLPATQLLRDTRTKITDYVPYEFGGFRRSSDFSVVLKYASEDRPGAFKFFRKKSKNVEIVTYNVREGEGPDFPDSDSDDNDSDGDLGDIDNQSDSTYAPGSSIWASSTNTSPPTSVPSSTPTPRPGNNNGGASGAPTVSGAKTTRIRSASDVEAMRTRMTADVEQWARSQVRAATEPAAAVPRALAGVLVSAPAGTSSSSGPRALGRTASTAILVPSSSDDESPAQGSNVPRAGGKRGLTLQGSLAGPPTKRTKTTVTKAE